MKASEHLALCEGKRGGATAEERALCAELEALAKKAERWASQCYADPIMPDKNGRGETFSAMAKEIRALIAEAREEGEPKGEKCLECMGRGIVGHVTCYFCKGTGVARTENEVIAKEHGIDLANLPDPPAPPDSAGTEGPGL